MRESPETHNSIWEVIRRSLGRLVSSVTVNRLGDDELVLIPVLGRDNPLTGETCAPGCNEPGWQPEAKSQRMALPAAVEGGKDADLAAICSVASPNGALNESAVTLQAVELPSNILATRGSPFLDPADCVARGVGMILRDCREWQASATLVAPAIVRLQIDQPQLPRRRIPPLAKRLGEKKADHESLAFGQVAVRKDLNVCADIPVLRSPNPAPQGISAAQAFAAERRQLAAKAQVPLEDVRLVGVYPNVPVAAVRRLAWEEEGARLSLWLKPEALAAGAGGKAPRFSTLIVGRQRSTGKIIQAVA